MSKDLMNYDKMTQLALRGVVRDAIRRVIREDGLPGAHHFYITFLTRYPGVEIDESLAKKYDDEITIVVEHQYWDLNAHNDSFEVTLKFGGVPKYLSVPYTAITRFHDPSVGFALQFDTPPEMQEQQQAAPQTLAQLKPDTAPTEVSNIGEAGKTGQASRAEKPSKAKVPAAKAETAKPKTAKKPKAKASKTDKEPKPDTDAAKVVSLDAFRKK